MTTKHGVDSCTIPQYTIITQKLKTLVDLYTYSSSDQQSSLLVHPTIVHHIMHRALVAHVELQPSELNHVNK